MKTPFSKALQEKIETSKKGSEIYKHVHRLNFIDYIVYYVINSKFRRSVHLQNWIKKQIGNETIEMLGNKFRKILNTDDRMKAILNHWRNGYGNLDYVGDKTTYGTNEYWATVDEILEKKEDDCDGFMTIIYLTAKASGISDYRLYCVCGLVKGNVGHAYVIYRANNGLEFPIDGCYWPNTSYSMKTPYFLRKSYNYGETEWWRFNASGSYKTS